MLLFTFNVSLTLGSASPQFMVLIADPVPMFMVCAVFAVAKLSVARVVPPMVNVPAVSVSRELPDFTRAVNVPLIVREDGPRLLPMVVVEAEGPALIAKGPVIDCPEFERLKIKVALLPASGMVYVREVVGADALIVVVLFVPSWS